MSPAKSRMQKQGLRFAIFLVLHKWQKRSLLCKSHLPLEKCWCQPFEPTHGCSMRLYDHAGFRVDLSLLLPGEVMRPASANIDLTITGPSADQAQHQF